MKKFEILGLSTVPEIKPGDNLGEIIVTCVQKEIGGLMEKEIIVVTSKIVSKAENRVIKKNEVKPSKKALRLSQKTGKDASKIQMIWDDEQEIVAVIPLHGLAEKFIMRAAKRPDQARKLLDEESCILVTKDKSGRLHTFDGGIDSSNHPQGTVSLPPVDPDRTAKEIREEIKKLTSKEVAVLIADTEVVPFGSIDLATGSSGIETMSKRFGEPDIYGKSKFGGMDIIAYELTAASSLLFGQTNERTPVTVIRGLDYTPSEDENILNSLVPDWRQIRKTVRSAVKATVNLRGFKS